jgi:hypothetical protein
MKETALNHVWMSGLLSDGFGATHGMMRNDLIWVVSRMQVLIDYYPIWLVLFLFLNYYYTKTKVIMYIRNLVGKQNPI